VHGFVAQQLTGCLRLLARPLQSVYSSITSFVQTLSLSLQASCCCRRRRRRRRRRSAKSSQSRRGSQNAFTGCCIVHCWSFVVELHDRSETSLVSSCDGQYGAALVSHDVVEGQHRQQVRVGRTSFSSQQSSIESTDISDACGRILPAEARPSFNGLNIILSVTVGAWLCGSQTSS